MPYAKTSLRAEQRDLREQMRGHGLSHRQIATEFTRRYGLRPRAAWRLAYGWSLKQAAEEITTYATRAGIDPYGTTMAMTGPHLCEVESWPGYTAAPAGRRPTPYLLSLLATTYGCTITDLLDLADYRHMRPADLLVLGKATSTGPHPGWKATGARPAEELLPADGHALGPDGTPPAEPGQDAPPPVLRVREASPSPAADEVGRREVTVFGTSALLAALSPWARGGTAMASLPGTNQSGPVCTAEMRKLVDKAKSEYQTCRYQALAAWLPVLLATAESTCVECPDDDRQRCNALRAEAYHVATSLLLKTGEHDLAWVMADRSGLAAQASGDPLALGSSARILTHVLLRTGHGGQASRLATQTATQIQAAGIAGPEFLSVYGSLLLRGAIAAASADNRATALELLKEAGDAARRLGADGNFYWTAFGPINVLVHRVHVAVRLGDAGAALDYAAKISPARITVPERRSSFWIDVASACAQRRWHDKALAALIAAEESAPEEARARPVVRALIAGLRASHPRGGPAGLEDLAARIGVPR
jgi:hypothetical protein